MENAEQSAAADDELSYEARAIRHTWMATCPHLICGRRLGCRTVLTAAAMRLAHRVSISRTLHQRSEGPERNGVGGGTSDSPITGVNVEDVR
jgi:hypothetical protein